MRCDRCNREFVSADGWEQHMKAKHRDAPELSVYRKQKAADYAREIAYQTDAEWQLRRYV